MKPSKKMSPERKRRLMKKRFKRLMNSTVDGLVGTLWNIFFYTMGTFFALILFTTYLVNSETATNKLVKKIVNYQSLPLKIDSLDIGKQIYTFPRNIRLENVKLDISVHGQEYRFKWKNLNINNVTEVFESRDFQIDITGLNIKSKDVVIRNGNANLLLTVENKKILGMTGDLDASKVVLNKLAVENLRSSVFADEDEIHLDRFSSDFYGGSFYGEVALKYTPEGNFRLKGFLDKVDLAKFREYNYNVFEKMQGNIAGNVNVLGYKNGLAKLSANFIGLDSVKIKAKTVKSLFDHASRVSAEMPKFETFDTAVEILKNDGYIPFEHANLQLHASTNKMMFGNISLQSLACDNMRLNLTSDIPKDAVKAVSLIK